MEVVAEPSPVARMQTHISFEELDDFVQLSGIGKWEQRLTVAFPQVVLSEEMVTTLCLGIKQSVKQVSHDSILLIELDCTNGLLSDESFIKIVSEAAPMAMRKSGRIGISKLLARGNFLTEKSLDELVGIAKLHKDAKYKYKVKEVIGGGEATVDLSLNNLSLISNLDAFLSCPSLKSLTFFLNISNNKYNLSALAGLLKNNACKIKVSPESLLEQKNQDEEEEDEEQVESKELAASSAPSSASSPSVEEMTKALLAGLKISKPSRGSEDISRSLLNLLHASAKQKEEAVLSVSGSSNGLINKNVQNLFDASSKTASTSLSNKPLDAGVGMSLTELEASLKQQPKPPSLVDRPFTTVRAPLKVFTPFPGAAPLCGLELRIDALGYRVVRVTEKPGQDGNIREGDVITAIDGEPLVALPGIIPQTDREKAIRNAFGKRLKDGVQLIIQRPNELASADLNPHNDTPIERKLDFGLMLLGAGIDWRSLVSKFPIAAQQAGVVCQAFGIEGKLETADSSPILHLKGPAGLVDKAMRQFCVVIVKGALLQQQQAATTA